mmetsp:Transcript_8212/g.18717  ORF Transcript_8212/g.18717 Transcript_8212/m.18717 type:complete len:240 (-) Transcript_8212:562-1281(-)
MTEGKETNRSNSLVLVLALLGRQGTSRFPLDAPNLRRRQRIAIEVCLPLLQRPPHAPDFDAPPMRWSSRAEEKVNLHLSQVVDRKSAVSSRVLPGMLSPAEQQLRHLSAGFPRVEEGQPEEVVHRHIHIAAKLLPPARSVAVPSTGDLKHGSGDKQRGLMQSRHLDEPCPPHLLCSHTRVLPLNVSSHSGSLPSYQSRLTTHAIPARIHLECFQHDSVGILVWSLVITFHLREIFRVNF